MRSAVPPATASIVLIGGGRVGTAVTYLMKQAGHDVVAVASRTDSSARTAAERLSAPVFRLEDPKPPEADIYLLGVTDDVLRPLADQLTDRFRSAATVIHFAGAFGISPLSPLDAAGHPVAALHPVQACPDVDTAIRRLPGSSWGVTCSPALEDWARRTVVNDLRGAPVMVPEEARPLWHASSVMTSNGIAAVMGFGESLLASAGIPPEAVVLGPLAAGTVQNAREGGGGSATLTGPIVRGDVSTIERHLKALESVGNEAKAHYLLVARAILMTAISAGRLTPEQAARVEEVLNR